MYDYTKIHDKVNNEVRVRDSVCDHISRQ